MPTHPLPCPPRIDLRDPATLTWWTQTPSRERALRVAALLRTCPVVTVPQYLAIALGRHPDAFGGDQLRAFARARLGQGHALAVSYTLDLRAHEDIWRHSHEDALVTVDWVRVDHSRLHHSHPLRALAGWWPRTKPISARLVELGLPAGDRQQRRAYRPKFWKRLHADGLVKGWESRSCPPYVLTFTRRSLAKPVSVHAPSLVHHCLAVDAALCLHFGREGAPPVTALRADAALARDIMQARRDAADRPDVELETEHDIMRVELISRHYSAADIAAKRDLSDRGCIMVATSPRTARRSSWLLDKMVLHM